MKMHYQHPTYKRLSYCGFKNRDRTDKFEEVENDEDKKTN